jgi:hydrogenase nickel incorporation protein HypA/HybF
MRLIDRPEGFLDQPPKGAHISMQKIPRLSSIFNHLLQQPRRVVSITIVVGELAVSTEDEIQTQWSMLVQNTVLSQAKLKVQRIPAEQQCMVCFQKYMPSNQETICPNCRSVGAKILAGEEFYLESFEEENE